MQPPHDMSDHVLFLQFFHFLFSSFGNLRGKSFPPASPQDLQTKWARTPVFKYPFSLSQALLPLGGARAGVWSLPTLNKWFPDGIAKPACRADGRTGLTGTLDRTDKKPACSGCCDPQHQGWGSGICSRHLSGVHWFPSPLFPTIFKTILSAFEKFRERWRIQPRQWVGALKTHVHLGFWCVF